MDDSNDVYLFRYIKDGPFVMVPVAVFDILMQELNGSEFKILMLIIRKTVGFQKKADAISYSQIRQFSGIKSSETIANALNKLRTLELINGDRKSRTEIMKYTLNLDAKISRNSIFELR